jgi:hypothetical protein
MSRKYSNTNPPYLEEAAAHFIRESGIQHLLIDFAKCGQRMKENFGSQSWNITDVKDLNADARINATITELIFLSKKGTRWKLSLEFDNSFI